MTELKDKSFDVICIGSCVIDILCSPVNLSAPLSEQVLNHVDPIEIAGGGLTLNSGTTAARLGMKTAIFTRVAEDRWLSVIEDLCQREGIQTEFLIRTPETVNSVTVVTISPEGERCFIHCQGAPKKLSGEDLLSHLDVLASSQFVLMGYYSLMPLIEPELDQICQALNQRGTCVALDASSKGGDLEGLKPSLPFLDVYVPSMIEASGQTELDNPKDILKCYRDHGSRKLIGIKQGEDGALLSPVPGEYLHIPAIVPVEPIVDTTGAGDAFMAGLVSGLAMKLDIEKAGRLAAAAASFCLTRRGGSTGGKDLDTTMKMAGINL